MTANTGTESQPDASTARETPLLPWQLSIEKLRALPAEQQELYLLTHVAELDRQIADFSTEAISRQQTEIKEELFKVITLKSPYPNRVVRNALGRCFQGLLEKGVRKLLAPYTDELLAILNAGKEQEIKTRHAAVYCVGVLFEHAGKNLGNHVSQAVSALIKVLKAAPNDAGLRAAVFRALGKIAKGVTGLDEDIARTIWKQARNASSGERTFWVQVNACECLKLLVQKTAFFDNPSDFDKLHSAMVKAMDSTSGTVRQAAYHCLAASFLKSWEAHKSGKGVVRAQKKTTTAKDPDLDEDVVDRVAALSPTQPSSVLAYSVVDILKQLTTMYIRPATSNRVRAALIACFIHALRSLTEAELESNYNSIAGYLLLEFISNASLHTNRYRYLISRKFVNMILDKAIAPTLGESAQLGICRYLLSILKGADASQAHSKASLCNTIEALSSIIPRLGAAVSTLASECRDSLLNMLEHENFAVKIQSCIALRHLMLACPQEILTTTTTTVQALETALNALGSSPSSNRRCVGLANAVCSLLSATAFHPLYGNAQTYADVMTMATNLLKASASSDLIVSACQVQVAWTLIGGLMPFGPNFVKVHLSQLLLIWKNTLPKPISKETVRRRSLVELSYLCHVRECALTSLRSFLSYNSRLVTAEVSRRLGVMLETSVAFLQCLPEKMTSEEPGTRLSPAFQLYDYDQMTRRRVYQCFSLLLIASPSGAPDLSTHSAILSSAIAAICSAEYNAPKSFSTSIASSIGITDDVWTAGDDFGSGVTSLATSTVYRDPLTGEKYTQWTSESGVELEVEEVVQSPVCSVAENDPMSCYLVDEADCFPAATEIVNQAIKVFALSLPVQMPKIQQSMVEQLGTSLNADALSKDPGRRAATNVNVALAIQSVLRVVTVQTVGLKYTRSGLGAEKALQDTLRVLLLDPEDVVRTMAGSALGMTCSLYGSEFTSTQVNWLTDAIVNNRTPEARAGCAFALAQIHSYLGSMAAGLHIRHIVGILTSLAADTHPLVHFWAIESLSKVADSAGLNYAAYVNGSVGIFSQLYTSDDHNRETALAASSNVLADRPVVAAIARGVSSLINVLGPDLQDMHKTRDMITTLVTLFSQEEGVLITQATLKCKEALSMFMPNHFDLQPYVQTLQQSLDVPDVDIRTVAIDGLRNIMRRDAESITGMAKPGLENRLWDLLDDHHHTSLVQSIFNTWLQQTALEQTDSWINRCGAVLTRTKSQQVEVKPQPEAAAVDLQDEDVAGLASNGEPAKDDAPTATSTQEFLRWQVRLYALESLQTLITLVSKDSIANGETESLAMLQQRIGDVIRMAFSASTAGVSDLRIVGLRIIEQILHLFGRTPDPDFSEAMLLEQYQAQISSALTPAFASDSTPPLAAEAINVCATFISTGIVTDVERMGRILKVLVTALDHASESVQETTIGDLRAYSKNAQIMFRTAVFSAWADLQVASGEHKYLVDVVRPHIPRMVPLWLESLKEYAHLRYEPDISATDAGTGSIDDVYASFNRQTLLTYYQDVWLSLVNAIASLIDEDSQVVFEALDGRSTAVVKVEEPTQARANGINYRDEPVAFFFVLFGLTFEAIATYGSDSDANKLELLQALRKILRPSVAGSAIYQEAIFAEAIDLMDRMALTDSLAVQTIIVEIATDLCMAHPSSRHDSDGSSGDTLSEDIEQLFELTRIVVLVLGDIIPGISETPGAARAKASEEANILVHAALQSLVNIADIFPAIIRTDLRDAILHIFVVMLSTGSCQAVMVPQSLPMFRKLVASMASQPLPHTDHQLTNALARLLATFAAAQEQESEVSLACQKNVLLACTLLITAASKILTHDQWTVQRFIAELQASLVDPRTSRVAVGCIRTLLYGGIAVKRLIGSSLSFVSEEDQDLHASQALALQTLTSYIPRTNTTKRSHMTWLLFNIILSWTEQNGTQVYPEAANRLIEVSQSDGETFRVAVASCSPEKKRLLQTILKDRMNDKSRSSDIGQEPTIALKFDFGR